jgi:predicted O-methyltransferase YrrM
MSDTGLVKFFKMHNINVTEGYTQLNDAQCNEIKNLLNGDMKLIMEIGFNAGHSAEIFLQNSNAYVYSFDIGTHFSQYLKYGKMYINNIYPDRHTLVFGDSKEAIPRFAKNNSDKKFDLIFIDGGHDYETALDDLLNCKNLAHENTILIMDDIIQHNANLVTGWTEGPTKAWNLCKKNNYIVEIAEFEWTQGRGMTVGKYIFN